MSLLRDHLLRLDPASRHDRFHGCIDDGFIERYATKCAHDGTVIIAYSSWCGGTPSTRSIR
jgi:hypothetical protein